MNNYYVAGGQSLEGRLAEIADYLQAGKKINAIKVYREVTGASLAEAKDAVDRLDMAMKLYGTMVVGEAIMEAMQQEMPQQWMSQQGMPMNMDMQNILLTEMAYLISQKKKIQAIKLFRERTGLGLEEGKAVADRIELMIQASGF